MKNYIELTCILIGLEVLDNRPIFSSIAQPVIKKKVVLFVNIDQQKKQNKKYRSLFIKYIQTIFLKATQSFQCDAVPWQSEAIGK